MNNALAVALPKPPEGLAWTIDFSGDGREATIAISLTDLFNPNRYVLATQYELPKGSQPTGIVNLVAQEAKSLLVAYERYEVLKTLPGLYDLWESVDLEEEENAA